MAKLPENYRKKIEHEKKALEKDPDLPDVTPEELEAARKEREGELRAASAHDNRYQDPYEGFEEKSDGAGQEKTGDAQSSLHASRQAMKKIMAGEVETIEQVHSTSVGATTTPQGEKVVVKNIELGKYFRRVEYDGFTVTWLEREVAIEFQKDAPELLELIATLENLKQPYVLEVVNVRA